MDIQYWPFPILPPEQLREEHLQEIRFLDKAYERGYQPFQESMNYHIGDDTQRSVWMFRRGRTRGWEMRFFEPDQWILLAWIVSFENASSIALQWCDGVDPDELMHQYQDNPQVRISRPVEYISEATVS